MEASRGHHAEQLDCAARSHGGEEGLLAPAAKARARRELSSAPPYSLEEEVALVFTHGLGLALSVAGLIVLLAAGQRGDGRRILSTTVYGATLVVLYAGCTLYHIWRLGDVGTESTEVRTA